MNTTKNSYNLLPISDILDNDSPLSFQKWKSSFEIILPEQAYAQYNEYLINWYKNRKKNQNDLSAQIKINFLNLLKQIQIYFTEEEKENWYTGINVDNEKEVLLAIPYFARKLKDISLYYLSLREQVKRSKLKYNLTGSNRSVVKQIQDILLQKYSKKENETLTLPSTLWAHLPQLSAIKNNFVVEVEELYDTASYFDRSLNLPPSAYFPLASETEKYFTSKGMSLSTIDWAYRLGTFSVSALYDPVLQGITDSGLSSLYVDVAQKYLGQDFYSSLLIEASSRKDFYTVNIASGNNFFFYPAGAYRINVTGLPRYAPVNLSATALQTLGTAGSSLDLADTIFVKTKKGVEAAWFRNKVLDVSDIDMKATLEGNGTTTFRFPYPGYGISAEDIEWTGYGPTTDPRYFYLDDTTKKIIEDVYWSSSFALSGVVPVDINSTSLINNGAYSSTDFNAADKIRIWPEPPQYSSTSYTGEVKEAWLYKFLKTNISVGTDTDNTILWPYRKLQITPETRSIPDAPNNICLSEQIADISMPFAIGSDQLSSADVVYKIKNFKDKKEDAVECAWLSAHSYSYTDKHTFGPRQQSFNAIFNAGEYTSFVWDYSDSDIKNIITGNISHASDCKFLTTPNTTYNDHKLCTCKQVYFAPFGHPGDNFNDYNGLCDFIVEDNDYLPKDIVNLSNWKDSNGLPFETSPNACWFKTSQNIGWGAGVWYSGATSTNNTFYLRKGKRYIYYRANTKNKDLTDESFPELVVRKETPEFRNIQSVWVNAEKNTDGTWSSTGKPSRMTINSNDLLIYSRTGSTYFAITGISREEVDTAEKINSIWSTYDYISIDHPSQYVFLSYPVSLNTSLDSVQDPQYPEVPFNQISKIAAWEITDPVNNKTTVLNQSLVSFKPSLTGLYTVAVTAVTGTLGFQLSESNVINNALTGYYYFTDIPAITCVPAYIEVPSLSTFTTPAPGFVLNTDLKGWNYTTNTRTTLRADITSTNIGAIPVWMMSNIDKDLATDYKAIESWSPALSFVDKYNPVPLYEVSDIVLKGGEYVEYKRKPQTRITWNEKVTVNNITDTREWCKLETQINSLPQAHNPSINLISNPTTEPSTLTLQNVIENEPVEIYYNSINSFTWNITAEPQIPEITYSTLLSSTAIVSQEPWSNTTNQFYPTVAHIPTFDSLFNNKQIGNYFKPNNLGLLTFINKDYTTESILSAVASSNTFGAPTQKINNRGLTREQQFTPYNITLENNIWLKEPFTTGSLAGTVKKDVFKKYQKFIPYQSTYESNPLFYTGLTTPTSRQHPWGGKQDSEWADETNRPINFTGEINVAHWVKDQVLKNTTLQLDSWVTDIYGNQYGLYKNIKNTTPSQRPNIPGQVWIRKNSQSTEPARVALLEVFDTYKNLSMYNELTGSGVYKLDVFHDTLFLETSGALIFEKINYDYNNAGVFSIADSARGISLAQPAQNNLNREFTNTLPVNPQYAKAGDTWFFANDKTIIISVNELENGNLIPNLYSYDLRKNNLRKIFTIPVTEQKFNDLNIIEVSRPVLTYNSTKRLFLYSFTAKNNSDENLIISIYINREVNYTLDKIKIYSPQAKEVPPPAILSIFNLTIPVNAYYSEQLQAIPSDSIFEPVNLPDWVTLTSSGLLTLTASNVADNYSFLYKATNSAGSTYSTLNISVIDEIQNLASLNNNNLTRINGVNLIEIFT